MNNISINNRVHFTGNKEIMQNLSIALDNSNEAYKKSYNTGLSRKEMAKASKNIEIAMEDNSFIDFMRDFNKSLREPLEKMPKKLSLLQAAKENEKGLSIFTHIFLEKIKPFSEFISTENAQKFLSSLGQVIIK